MQTLVFEIYGLCGLLVQTLLLRYLLRAVGEVRVLSVGLVAAAAQMVALAFVRAKWQVWCRRSSPRALPSCLLLLAATQCGFPGRCRAQLTGSGYCCRASYCA